MVNDQNGALQVPLALAFVIVVMISFALIALLHAARLRAEQQLRLDHCVGQTATRLAKDLNRIEASNKQIRFLRLSSAALPPGTAEALSAAIVAEAAIQDVIRWRWSTKQGRWLIQRGCDSRGDVSPPLPSMKWFRPPPDSLGPKPLEWAPDRQKDLVIRLSHSPGVSAAEVKGEKIHETHSGWTASWRPFGPSLP